MAQAKSAYMNPTKHPKNYLYAMQTFLNLYTEHPITIFQTHAMVAKVSRSRQ